MANLFIYGRITKQAMIHCIHQEPRDAKLPDPVEEPSPGMQAARRRFSKNQAMSMHLNLITIFAMLWYRFKLASRLDVGLN
ncbi:hypothetical protein CI238_00570 [Colletotrichum incanum]|uniref:Uncharacterized protein n=1 Tax=Colletotrichum incanum TaxID=1573173 RepID=A0A161VFC4_COLIC|nr:hypothetical protein CI238_00570 [Colletotrichum incanum]OHW92219.1 hypothetical protein CSPAE12_09230 [Colletotrichum incanum]